MKNNNYFFSGGIVCGGAVWSLFLFSLPFTCFVDSVISNNGTLIYLVGSIGNWVCDVKGLELGDRFYALELMKCMEVTKLLIFIFVAGIHKDRAAHEAIEDRQALHQHRCW